MLDKPFSLRGYVVGLFDHEGLDKQGAIEALVERADTEPALKRALLIEGAKHVVRDYYHFGRGETYPITGARSDIGRHAMADLAKMTKAEQQAREAAKENRRLLIDTYTLYGHTSLRDARKDDLRQSINNRQQQVNGNMRAIHFEQAILAKMKSDTKTCGELLSPQAVDKIWMRFYGK